jgi:hypothetical protein
MRTETMADSKKCPLCGRQKARRACPALGQQICAVCCGTKRLTEIQCPADCPYLASAREHPAAAILRRQQRDVGLLVHVMRDLNTRQAELFLLVLTFLTRHEPAEPTRGSRAWDPNAAPALGWERIVDADVADAASALAATFETASRGVIYEHRPSSRPAAHLMTELKPVLADARKGAGSSFERDAAVVLRRLEDAVRDVRVEDRADPRAFLALLGRVITPAPADEGSPPDATPSRLILP